MIRISSPLSLAVTVGVVLSLVACDQSVTGVDDNQAAQVLLSSAAGSSVSYALLSGSAGARTPENGQIDLATIEHVNVEITGISILLDPAEVGVEDDAEGGGDASWVALDLSYDPEVTFFDLRNLSGITALATVPAELSGEIRAIRLYFGDAEVIFAGETEGEPLFIPSGKVTISTANLALSPGQDVAVIFEAGPSIHRIKRTGRGLLMPPVFTVRDDDGDLAGRNDDDEEEDDDAPPTS